MASPARPLALVTGASGGIGADLARELAKGGHDLVLTARTVPAMQALADELKARGANSTVIAADLAKPGAAAELANSLDDRALRIDVLVNNAGLGGVGRFDQMDPQRVSDMVMINVLALTELTRLLVPAMVARGRGRVMLVASTASFQPGPRMAVYFATKSYVLSLGEALAYELRGTGVTVTTLCPGATATNFFKAAGANENLMPAMSASEVARVGYRALQAGRRVVITGMMNRILALGGRYGPHWVTLPATAALMSRR
ncbi:MAG: SDR family oxidoreductase [Alphaproteobacteria bacterium]|nr:SDR family oxidoreductase [Alphaproteobacteria bacterium]